MCVLSQYYEGSKRVWWVARVNRIKLFFTGRYLEQFTNIWNIVASTYKSNYFDNHHVFLHLAMTTANFARQLPEMLKDPFGRKKRLCLRRTLTGPWWWLSETADESRCIPAVVLGICTQFVSYRLAMDVVGMIVLLPLIVESETDTCVDYVSREPNGVKPAAQDSAASAILQSLCRVA